MIMTLILGEFDVQGSCIGENKIFVKFSMSQ